MRDSDFYTDHHRELQNDFDTRALADRMELAIVVDELSEQNSAFIASRDYFYLATVTTNGEPTVSYKGGSKGFVSIIDSRTLVFPIYDGNGMFLSAGNMADTGKVGLLFMDFEIPQRLRVQGNVSIDRDDELLAHYPGALLVCRVAITDVFVNCARYIHPHTRVEQSRYVPDDNGNQPLPSWKRIDGLQDVLADEDLARVEDAGGVITDQEYGAKLMAGES